MSKNVNLIIFFISFCFTLNAQDDDIAYQKYRNNYSLDIFFEDGDSLPYVMQQGYIEYSNNDKDRIIQRHGNEIKFLYFLPPKTFFHQSYLPYDAILMIKL